MMDVFPWKQSPSKVFFSNELMFISVAMCLPKVMIFWHSYRYVSLAGDHATICPSVMLFFADVVLVLPALISSIMSILFRMFLGAVA